MRKIKVLISAGQASASTQICTGSSFQALDSTSRIGSPLWEQSSDHHSIFCEGSGSLANLEFALYGDAKVFVIGWSAWGRGVFTWQRGEGLQNDPKQPHFALEVANWDATLAHLDALGVEYSRTGQAFSRVGTGGSERWGKREDSGEHYTYLHDPDGNLIELVYHPLGLVDVDGKPVALPEVSPGLRWRQLPEVEAELGKLATA